MPQPRFQLIVMDLDGTLLDSHSQVRPRTRAALEHAHNAGVAIAVATGRSYALARHFTQGLPLSGPQITYNGAIVVEAESGRTVFLEAVPTALIAPVLDFLREHDLYTCYFTEEHIYVRGRADSERALVPPGFPQPIVEPNLERLIEGCPCLKLVAVATPARIEAIRPLAEQTFGGRLYVTQTASVLLEFLHPKVSKGAALGQAILDLGITPAEVIAFGDSHNDIEMLTVAGIGVAMANASAEVRAIADHITPSNDDDGIAAALDELLWT